MPKLQREPPYMLDEVTPLITQLHLIAMRLSCASYEKTATIPPILSRLTTIRTIHTQGGNKYFYWMAVVARMNMLDALLEAVVAWLYPAFRLEFGGKTTERENHSSQMRRLCHVYDMLYDLDSHDQQPRAMSEAAVEAVDDEWSCKSKHTRTSAMFRRISQEATAFQSSRPQNI